MSAASFGSIRAVAFGVPGPISMLSIRKLILNLVLALLFTIDLVRFVPVSTWTVLCIVKGPILSARLEFQPSSCFAATCSLVAYRRASWFLRRAPHIYSSGPSPTNYN